MKQKTKQEYHEPRPAILKANRKTYFTEKERKREREKSASQSLNKFIFIGWFPLKMFLFMVFPNISC